jgi:Domain of unknown function (DUF4281)
MSDEQLFLVANYSVMPAWLLLAVAPRWEWTQRLVHSALYPALLGAAYTVGFLAAGAFSVGGDDSAGIGSLAAISAAFASPRLMLVGWVHYLVFDLFVGAWEARDAQRHGIPHLLLIPCLLLTFMAGPMGLLLYLAIRTARARTMTLAESGPAKGNG